MAAPPYQKLFWGSYHKHTAHLSHAREHGAYLLLIGALWNNEGRLPGDDDTLAAYAKLTVKEWVVIKPKLFRPGLLRLIRGKLGQDRVTEDLAKYRDISGKRKAAGKTGGEASAGKYSENGQANAARLPTKPEPEPKDKNPPIPPAGGPRSVSFEGAWRLWHTSGAANRGPDEAWSLWPGCADRCPGGETELLVCVRAHLSRLAANPRETRKAFHRWLRDDGFTAYLSAAPAAPDWPGPPEVWNLVAAPPRDEAYAISWLSRCTWSDVPKAVIGGATSIDKLRADLGREFEERGIELRERAA